MHKPTESSYKCLRLFWGPPETVNKIFFSFPALVQDSDAWNIWPSFNLRQVVDGMRVAAPVSNDKTQKQKLNKMVFFSFSSVVEKSLETSFLLLSFQPQWIPRNNPSSSQLLQNARQLCVRGGRHCSKLPLVPGSTHVWMCEYNPPAIPQARAANALGDGSPAQTRLRSYVLWART